MLKVCGLAVLGSSITKLINKDLYTLLTRLTEWAGYKWVSCTTLCAQFIQLLSHSILRESTTVNTGLIPIIHTTNKYYKNFLFKNIIIYYRGAVHNL